MAVITRRGVHSYGVAMKIIEDTDISLTYTEEVVFGDGHRRKQTRLCYSIVKI
jgi:hypothetical protein